MSLRKNKNTISGMISFRSLIISVILGLSAFFLIISDIQINLPGSNLLTDPREIFVVISAAITGPIGGMLSGALAAMYDPNKDLIFYIILQHMFASLCIGFGYKYLVFRNYSVQIFIAGWILLILVYYYVCYIPIYAICYFFFPRIFAIINNSDAPLWSSLIDHYKAWSYEVIFTTIYSLLVMPALPFRYSVPQWGKIDLSSV